ncbi:MAG: hypothetical protein H6557_36390 [Lewinellaceae bacterium]|nr:hypothetical protein [Phaeodactylibacter sp.]MCB9042128.1 hypothetical protein [Lewinellaceae bacterium]
MPDILYKSFLADESEYHLAEQYWKETFEQIIAPMGYSYRGYLNTNFVDGTPLQDGNPIFHAYVPEVGRALRIIQEEPEEPADFCCWENETEWPDGTLLSELVISLVLTEETKAQAEEAIRKWLNSSM